MTAATKGERKELENLRQLACKASGPWRSMRDGTCPCGGDDCWKCAATQAVTPPPWADPSSAARPKEPQP
jgi:hypothetical protein